MAIDNPPEPIAVTILADLASAGFSISRKSFMQVNFEVHHVKDRGGYLRDLLEERLQPNGSPPTEKYKYIPRETITSAANGIGLVIATYAGTLPREMQSRRQGSSLPVALKIDDEDRTEARVFSGTAWSNPTFIYESTSVFEGLISIDDEPRMPSYEHGLAVGELLHQISDLAAGTAKAPILLLQCPVQMPPERSVSPDIRAKREEWPSPSAIAVRFAIALQHPSAQQRLDLGNRLSQICYEKGYGFWLTDRRVGSRPGNWLQIRHHDQAVARAKMPRPSRKSGASGPLCAFPVTFVGPARVGSTNAILRFCREFRDLGILGCSITSLDDLAFIHLRLAINEVPPSSLPELQRRIEERIRSVGEAQKPTAKTSTPQVLLPALLPELIGHAQSAPADDALNYLMQRAGNYQALAGPAMPMKNMDSDRKPLWFAWQSQSSDTGLAAPVIAFMDALESLGPTSGNNGAKIAVIQKPNIEYLVCRDMGNSVLRGKGKVSLGVQFLTRAPRLRWNPMRRGSARALRTHGVLSWSGTVSPA